MARRAWSEEEEDTLLTNLTSLVDQGVWRTDDGAFRPSYLEVLKNEMRVSFPQASINEIHIEGKIKKWKSDYRKLDAILRRPGFGWNPNENKLVVGNETWNEFVRDQRHLRHFRDMQFPHFNRWAYCFVSDEN
ncbi:uncharacterized protein LOC131329549 [Rhododendron vialii]|uniref:uncharacterized protein LOC131329549 n=1 Tax=Rhododendron vialii TaxID=182163 RepID=UPI00265DE06A|nr:uncharacterized protein LOC131329549 [Rhododendron vialii]